jgi:3-oxo-5-alpha-steroid 4-dehydrogenase 3 / polyprenol reductase
MSLTGLLMQADSQDFFIFIVRAYFLATSVVVLGVRFIPSFRVFIPYGKTRSDRSKSTSTLQFLSNITVPKSWFWHYYLLSVSLSVFWGIQFFECNTGGSCMLPWLTKLDGTCLLAWGLMCIQGCRRLYETLYVQRLSEAKMWIGHYAIGCAFYLMMSVAVFAETGRPDGTLFMDEG